MRAEFVLRVASILVVLNHRTNKIEKNRSTHKKKKMIKNFLVSKRAYSHTHTHTTVPAGNRKGL